MSNNARKKQRAKQWAEKKGRDSTLPHPFYSGIWQRAVVPSREELRRGDSRFTPKGVMA